MSKKITIIGGGPAGYEAALHGASLGGDMTLIEGHKIGGTCLNYGCIPTKTLIEDAAFYKKLSKNSHMGIETDAVRLDYAQIMNRKNQVIDSLCSGVSTRLKKAGVKVLEGEGRIKGPETVVFKNTEGEEEIIESDAIVLATGSKPIIPDFEGVDNPCVITSKELLSLDPLPSSIVIVGGGVIGMEFAGLLNDFGVQVTVLEYAKNLLPAVDSGLGKRLKAIMAKDGVQIITGAKVTAFHDRDNGIAVCFEGKKGVQEVTGDYALLAMGRIGNFDMGNMKANGISCDERFVHVDSNYMTHRQNTYAIGDMNGISLLAHAAYDQARQLMDHLLKGSEVIEKPIPACVFTSPEISTVGLSEDSLKEMNTIYTSEKTLFSASGKALAMGESQGFIKTLADPEGKILGCHILGPHASDLIHYAAIAMNAGLTIGQMGDMIFAHPTLGELFNDNMHQFK